MRKMDKMDIEEIVYQFNRIIRKVCRLEKTELGDLVSSIWCVKQDIEELRDTVENTFKEK